MFENDTSLLVARSLFLGNISTIIFGESTNQQESMNVVKVISIFMREAVGGAILGLIAGYLAFILLKKIIILQVA